MCVNGVASGMRHSEAHGHGGFTKIGLNLSMEVHCPAYRRGKSQWLNPLFWINIGRSHYFSQAQLTTAPSFDKHYGTFYSSTKNSYYIVSIRISYSF